MSGRGDRIAPVNPQEREGVLAFLQSAERLKDTYTIWVRPCTATSRHLARIHPRGNRRRRAATCSSWSRPLARPSGRSMP